MIAILTGDIVNSRRHEVQNWLPILKKILNQYGSSPLTWEIFRGDSFQLKSEIKTALWTAIHIKATIKQFKNLDVRIAIGLGEESYKGERISESNGEAYINSGECFESLQKQKLAVSSKDLIFDQNINLMLNLAALTTDYWTSTVAKTIVSAIEQPKKNQKELATLLNKSQSNISELLNRGGYDEIFKLNQYYQQHIVSL